MMGTGEPDCVVVRAGAAFVGKQGLQYTPGISAQTAGARHLHLQLLTIPPGGRARAHKHASHETAIHVLSGRSAFWYGPKLERHATAVAGDYVYIPADMPHLPYNLSDTEPCTAIVARTDPNEQEGVILLPELERVELLAPQG